MAANPIANLEIGDIVSCKRSQRLGVVVSTCEGPARTTRIGARDDEGLPTGRMLYTARMEDGEEITHGPGYWQKERMKDADGDTGAGAKVRVAVETSASASITYAIGTIRNVHRFSQSAPPRQSGAITVGPFPNDPILYVEYRLEKESNSWRALVPLGTVKEIIQDDQ